MNKYWIYTISLLMLLAACTGEEKLLPQDYINYINNPANGYIQLVENKGLKVECLYKPLDFEALYRLQTDKISEAQLDSVKKELGNNAYYELRIYRDKNLTEDMQMYIDYGMERELCLVKGRGDTLKPNSYLAEPDDGISPFRKILISFPNNIDIENYNIVIAGPDSSLYSNLAFAYNTKAIKRAKLKLTE